MIDDGGPAFPNTAQYDEDGSLMMTQYGMSLRDWFAGMALQGILPKQGNAFETAADYAYRVADLMLEARKEQP